MNNTLKIILSTLAVIAVIISVPRIITYFAAPQPAERSVFQYSKQEYEDEATANCVTGGGTESYCRCFYNGLLKNNTVQQVLKFDAQADAEGDNYQVTQEQKELVAQCL